MSKVQDDAPELSDAQREWLEKNLAQQQQRYATIVDDMEQLAGQRDEWVEQFLARLQTRGFNYNCDQLRTIEAEDLPAKPERPFKVVF